jgi:hypothetical protein
LKAFSLAADPHAIVCTFVSPVGATEPKLVPTSSPQSFGGNIPSADLQRHVAMATPTSHGTWRWTPRISHPELSTQHPTRSSTSNILYGYSTGDMPHHIK